MTKKDRLAEFERRAFPSTYFDTAKKHFRDYYLDEARNLEAAEKAFRNLVVLLTKSDEFLEPKVVSRLKDRSEAVRKFDRKYRDKLESDGVEYEIKDYITDLIGVRVICIYESDIERVADALRNQFEVIEETDKSKEIEETVSSFGYKGLHLDLRLQGQRGKLPEYKAFADQRFEVQIRSIVQDAWSELDHRLKYKRQTPPNLQRRIATLAALFEMADREFEQVKSLSEKFELEATDKSKVVDEENTRFDLFGFIRVTSDFFDNYSFAGEPLERLIDDIVRSSSNLSVSDFRAALNQKLPQVQEYAGYLETQGHGMTPYTQIRHSLYSWNSSVFEGMIFVGHRKNFDRWIKYGTVHPSEVP